MKKAYDHKIFALKFLLSLIAFCPGVTYGQKKTGKSFPVPEDINAIFTTFCYSCHGPEGGRLPHSKLNFTVWAGYGPGKQVDKAGAICSSVTKGTMPTKLWKKQNPGLKLTQDQIDRVCEWAGTIKIEGEKNARKRQDKRLKPLTK